MGIPPPIPQCDVAAPLAGGVDDVPDKPGSSTPTGVPNVPQRSQEHIAGPSTQGQSYMADCQVLERNQDQDRSPPAGQPPAASGGAQPTAPAAVPDDIDFIGGAFTSQQTTSEHGMAPSVPKYKPTDEGNQSVGMPAHHASPAPLPNGRQSPTLSSGSADSVIVHREGDAPTQTRIAGQIARETHRRSASGARRARSIRYPSPKTRSRVREETLFACGLFQEIPTSTRSSGSSHPPDIDISDEESQNNPKPQNKP